MQALEDRLEDANAVIASLKDRAAAKDTESRARHGTEEELRQQLTVLEQEHKRDLRRKTLQIEQLSKEYNALQVKLKTAMGGRQHQVSCGAFAITVRILASARERNLGRAEAEA